MIINEIFVFIRLYTLQYITYINNIHSATDKTLLCGVYVTIRAGVSNEVSP